MMDLRSGLPLWLVKDGLPCAYPRLNKNLKTDVLILGGGITGAIMAHYLVKNNISCIVADARTIGLGSTCASTSLLQYQIDVPLSKLAQKVGKAAAIRAYQLCAEAVDTLEEMASELQFSLVERKKTLYYASNAKDKMLVDEEYDLHRAAGFDVEYWDERTISHHMGFSAPAAIYSNHSAQVDAYMFTHALLQQSMRKGLQVFDRTNIVKFTHSRNHSRVYSEQGFSIEANKVIYATGYEAVRFVPKKVVDLHSTYAFASEHQEQQDQWFENCLIWETKEPYLYMRTTSDKRIVVGGRDEKFYNPSRRDRQVKAKTKSLAKDFGKLFPQIEMTPEFSWTGTFGSTRDGLPFIGECPGVANGLFALGFGGNGITFSTIAAQLITDALKGRKNRDSNLFSFNR